ncbi:inorganic phosphate transporter [Futiania mangrovi]|uniref:Phosphate transporter n=1 Tax=Futiania mangrovi TaxID=2959716 RepID=A0A9J6PD74_9PROT|nr:inorganic phosphate transporter [Futiania mangrovii]MCP1336553.1 inorganic phosphate transporter [Futiania mangrovii]
MSTTHGETRRDRARDPGDALKKPSLDKDLEKLVHVEAATRTLAGSFAAPALALLFLGCSGVLAGVYSGVSTDAALVIFAAILGGYMALNIGANDVANNVGPAVGARALTMTGALLIAAVFESAGALLAGGDVVSTISKGIIDPARVADSQTFIWAMMAALVSSALWVNLATWVGAPVSTTHAVVGGVAGAGIAAAGWSLVNWPTMGAIAASWVISPVLGGVIAALFLAFIKVNLIYREDKIAAARKWIPLLVAIMAGAFAWYLSIKGFQKIWRPDTTTITLVTIGTFAGVWALMRPLIRRQSRGMENRNQSLRRLFRIPLIFSAALLSFAHGANDVANAVAPLAAILHSVQFGDVAAKVAIPMWVMLIGAFGISLGLFLYGPKLIRMVGAQITKMNPMRAYCVALSAAVTVIVASWLGLPVSSTHIAVGAVFGVGFFREYYTRRSKRRRELVRRNSDPLPDIPEDEMMSRKLVRRAHFLTVVAAWVVTVPASALLAAVVFWGLTTFVPAF